MKNLLFLLVAALVVLEVACMGELCMKDKECNQKNNERCQKFDACKEGKCVCKEDYMTWLQVTGNSLGSVTPPTGLSGVCLSVIKVGSACSNDTIKGTCGFQAKCWNSKCTCFNENYESISDGYSCKIKNSDGFHGDGGSCSTPFTSFTCSGGTTCVSGATCRCPSGSTWNTAFKACVHDKTETDLEEGDRCDMEFFESNEYITSLAALPNQVCKRDMNCAVCPEERHKSSFQKKTCMKASYNGASSVQVNVLVALSLTLLASLY